MAALLPLVLVSSLSAQAEPADECRFPAKPGIISAISERGEILLDDGKTILLTDIRLPDGEQAIATLEALRRFEGSAITVNHSSKSDRWGRLRGRITLEWDEDLAVFLIDNGFALVDSGSATALCNGSLLVKEEIARRFRRGLWRNPIFRPVPARDIERLSTQNGRFLLVEGRIRSIGDRPQRAYLNFGVVWSQDFTVTMAKDVRDAMARQNRPVSALSGRWVRVRGIVEQWGGPVIELTAPEMLEILPDTDPGD